jgi:hypothetical protein
MNLIISKKTLQTLVLSIFICFTAVSVQAALIQPEEAKIAARNWLMHGPAALADPVSVDQLQIYDGEAFKPYKADSYKNEIDTPLVYLVNFTDGSFVLLSADDNSIPVLAYSAEPRADGNMSHPSFLEWIDTYETQIADIIRQGLDIPENQQQWQELKESTFSTDYRQNRAVAPLMSTNWDQGWPYNELCPEDSQGPGGHVYAGCVATAVGMVMKYWNHPQTGVGANSYYAPGYGYQNANFGATTYLWDEMPNSVGSSNIPVATLLYHIGVAVEMGYSPDGSGAQSSDAATAMATNFRYPDAALHQKDYYTDTQWNSLLTDQIDNASPIYYSGHGSGGHAFVVDGYDTANYFHFNFGWSGSYNGYYYVNNINPGGSYFSQSQAAIINSIPEDYSIANTRIRMNTAGATAGNELNLSVTTDPVLGSWDVDHYSFQLFYDHNAMDFTGATIDGTFASNGTLSVTETTPGFLQVCWDGFSNLTGSGDLINFGFVPYDSGDYLFDIMDMEYNYIPVTNTQFLMVNVQAPVATLAESQISMINVMHLGYNQIGRTEVRTTYLLPSWNVEHYHFDVVYDPTKLEFVGIEAEGTINEGHGVPQATLDSPGLVQVIFDADSPIAYDGTLLKIDFRAIGNSSSLVVTQVTLDNFYYNDTQITSLGSANFILAALTSEEDEIAEDTPALRIWPNPISDTANISFSSKSDWETELKIYNLKGQLIRSMSMGRGSQDISWDVKDDAGNRLASGIYYLSWQQDKLKGRSKILILK